MRIIALILSGLFFNACSAAGPLQGDNAQSEYWSTDVIGINEMHLSANYWVEHTQNASQVLMNMDQIAAFKKEIYASNQHMVDLAQ